MWVKILQILFSIKCFLQSLLQVHNACLHVHKHMYVRPRTSYSDECMYRSWKASQLIIYSNFIYNTSLKPKYLLVDPTSTLGIEQIFSRLMASLFKWQLPKSSGATYLGQIQKKLCLLGSSNKRSKCSWPHCQVLKVKSSSDIKRNPQQYNCHSQSFVISELECDSHTIALTKLISMNSLSVIFSYNTQTYLVCIGDVMTFEYPKAIEYMPKRR